MATELLKGSLKSKSEIGLFNLEVISPVHIFSGDELNPDFDYKFISDRNKNFYEMCIYDQDKVIEFCINNNKDIVSFFKKELVQNENLREKLKKTTDNLSKEESNIRSIKLTTKGKTLINGNLSEMPYIPGSSIKGYLRSALMWWKLYKDSNLKIKVKDALIKEIGEISRTDIENGKLTDTILNEIFNILNIKGITKNERSLKDILKLVSISDANYLSGCKPILYKSIIDFRLSGKPDRSRKIQKKNILPRALLECINPGTKFRFSINFTKSNEFEEYFKCNSIEKLIKILDNYAEVTRAFYNDIYEKHYKGESKEELKRGRDYIKSKKPNLHVGGARGFYFFSIFCALFSEIKSINGKRGIVTDTNTLYPLLYKILPALPKGTDRKNKGQNYFPNTLKKVSVNVNNQQMYFTPGWCRIERI